MSMLAGPRRRQKISSDPRNSAWVNDESKYGKRMLEKMGWAEGKGLGADESGQVDHVKVKAKSDLKGVGFTNKTEDSWIAHQDDFNSLLASLSQDHGNDTQPTIQSLEKKSQTSKRRVHYHKFTRGKDLSSASSTDLNSIMGRRDRGSSAIEENNSLAKKGKKSEAVEKIDVDEKKLIEAESSPFTTSTLSVSDYFAQKMALKMKSASVNNVSQKNITSEDKLATDSTGICDDDEECLTESREQSEKLPSSNVANSPNTECGANLIENSSKKKSKKSKKRKLEGAVKVSNKNFTFEKSSEIYTDDDKKSSTKAKKKSEKILVSDANISVTRDCDANKQENSRNKKLKKTKIGDHMTIQETSYEQNVEKTISNIEESNTAQQTISTTVLSNEKIKRKKSTRKTNKSETDEKDTSELSSTKKEYKIVDVSSESENRNDHSLSFNQNACSLTDKVNFKGANLKDIRGYGHGTFENYRQHCKRVKTVQNSTQ